MIRKPYSSAMTKHLFWFTEFKIIVRLLNEGKNMDEIKRLNKAENLLTVKTVNRRKIIFNVIAARINAIPKDFIELCGKTDISTQKLIAVIAVMALESLFYDFIFEVYREKLMMGDKTITIGDFILFFRNKQIQDERISAWTDTTFNRLGRAYRNVLLKSGLIKNLRKNEWVVEKPLINRQLVDTLQKAKMEVFYYALTGEKL
ncbi:hypothetical protein R84B8_02525 [Treponema sp. R8-4-B8]